MKTDETNPNDWFMLGRERLDAADAVRSARGVCSSAVELLQEAVERYLKGYLVSTGWPLQRVHNLSTLLDAAVQRDVRFKPFADLCEGLTAQFWEQHYPGGDLADVGADYDLLRAEAAKMVSLIVSAGVPPEPPRPCA
jgi:HEPN domain-containing protein